jgi:RNA polymerase sigma-70 factor (ECF subfamily)
MKTANSGKIDRQIVADRSSIETVNTIQRNPFSARVRRCAIELARRGPSALGSLYDLTAPRLLRYAKTLTRNTEDAEDVLQSAMVRVSLHPQALAQAKFPWAYFLRIVRNEALTLARRRKPVQVLSPLTEPCVEFDPSLNSKELKQHVQRAIGRLPRSQAEVVVLRIWEEMTFLEIAEVLNQSPNTVASRYRYALEKLTRLLHAYNEQEQSYHLNGWLLTREKG